MRAPAQLFEIEAWALTGGNAGRVMDKSGSGACTLRHQPLGVVQPCALHRFCADAHWLAYGRVLTGQHKSNDAHLSVHRLHLSLPSVPIAA